MREYAANETELGEIMTLKEWLDADAQTRTMKLAMASKLRNV